MKKLILLITISFLFVFFVGCGVFSRQIKLIEKLPKTENIDNAGLSYCKKCDPKFNIEVKYNEELNNFEVVAEGNTLKEIAESIENQLAIFLLVP